MTTDYIRIEQSPPLAGSVPLTGAKNAVLVIMASLLLTAGKSKLSNVPLSDDVVHMIELLQSLGATVSIDSVGNTLEIDTTSITDWRVDPALMRKMRASILVMGPLLARFGQATVALPGGCVIGARPIDFHLKAFAQMGARIAIERDTFGESVLAQVPHKLQAQRIVLEYPSVGATENILMAAIGAQGITQIINAALEPEVLDLITVLSKMGAHIIITPPAGIVVHGGALLHPIEHKLMYDRLEAGSLILAAAVTGGELTLDNAPVDALDVFLYKLQEMGHTVTVTPDKRLLFKATAYPKAVSFKTMPYPGFPTDLQAPMMAVLCLASGTSVVHETVFENRLLHVRELQKMGAQITLDGHTAVIQGVEELYGTQVIATDIRASCALLLVGLVARGQTVMTGVHHLQRGYQGFVEKLKSLGGNVSLHKI